MAGTQLSWCASRRGWSARVKRQVRSFRPAEARAGAFKYCWEVVLE